MVYSPGDRHQITVAQLRAAADAQGVRIEPGDILLVRSGWIAWYLGLDAQARETLAANPIVTAVGLAQGEETLRYLWNNHFAAVAGDTVAFEAYPLNLVRVCTRRSWRCGDCRLASCSTWRGWPRTAHRTVSMNSSLPRRLSINWVGSLHRRTLWLSNRTLQLL